jgi:hypothetical protein
MLVMEELKKRNIAWEQFISSTHLQLNVSLYPQSKVQSLFKLIVMSTQRQVKIGRENTFLKMMRLLRNKKKKKKKGELITLHKGNFHPNQLQN